ncbi:Myb family transcription factor protein [Rutstroemia sp. NJR-2017a BBW]|nr:Myb family transcription factor protein [Rutstroemia sp. NJR-2017a BBW]
MSRTRRKWTSAEDQILIEAMTRANRSPQPVAWHLIAQSLKYRTNKDCRKRWHSKLAANVNKGPWLPDEDSRLYDAVQIYGSKWVLVASQERRSVQQKMEQHY